MSPSVVFVAPVASCAPRIEKIMCLYGSCYALMLPSYSWALKNAIVKPMSKPEIKDTAMYVII